MSVCGYQGTHQDPGEPRHSRALTHGHSPTAPEQSEQSWMLVTGSITRPRPGEGIDQDPSRECRQEQQEMGPEASGMQGCKLSPRGRGTSRRQITYNTEPKHVPSGLLGQHFPAGQSIVPRAIVPNQRGSLSTLRAGFGLGFVCFYFLQQYLALSYFSTEIFHVMSRSYFYKSYFCKISQCPKSTESRRIHFLSLSKMWEVEAACSRHRAAVDKSGGTPGRGQTP